MSIPIRFPHEAFNSCVVLPSSTTLIKVIDKVGSIIEDLDLFSGPTRAFYWFGGLVAGAITPLFLVPSGLLTALHEVIGHGHLGIGLTTEMVPRRGPFYQFDALDNWRAIQKATDKNEKIIEIWRFFTGFDRNGDGKRGVTNWFPGPLTRFGNSLGVRGTQAWVSISGSLPQLLLDNLMMIGGIRITPKAPLTGGFFTFLAFENHLIHSAYPLEAVFMNSGELVSKAANGHDYANFAVQIGAITGVSARVVAIVTALLFVASVPTSAYLAYKYTKRLSGTESQTIAGQKPAKTSSD